MIKDNNGLEQECHVISYSEYVDKQIASKLTLPTPLGIGFEIWLNKNGNVIGCLYYRQKTPITKQKEGST